MKRVELYAKSRDPSATPIPTRVRARARGFTLLEVMIALVITAIGLLGIAKIQALAYASTGSASLRSLVALQASSLAATMHANRNYWSTGLVTPIVITGSHITSDAAMDGTAATANYCTPAGNGSCTAAIMAAYDLHTYATTLNGMLSNSNPTTTITCPTLSLPISCTIVVTWNEHAVSIDQQSVNGTSNATFLPTYTLYVEP
jgi:type IV pilus assembly protein PilV